MKKTFKNLFISLLVLLFAFMLISCKPEPDTPPVPENNDEETKEEEQEKNSLAGRYIYKTPEEIILLSATEYGTGLFQAYLGNPEAGYFLEACLPLSFVYGENTITAIIGNEVFAILEYNPSTNVLRDIEDETMILQPLDCPNNQVELNKDLIGKWEAAAPLEEGESGPSEKMIYEFTANGYLISDMCSISGNVEIIEMSSMFPISGDDENIVLNGESSSYVLSEDKNTLTLTTKTETLQLKKLSAPLESIPEGTYIAQSGKEVHTLLIKDGLFIANVGYPLAILDITADQITLADSNTMDIVKVPYKYENDVFEFLGQEFQEADLDILPMISSWMFFISEVSEIDSSERINIQFDLRDIINEDPEWKAELEAICEMAGIEPPTEYREDGYFAFVVVNDNGNESVNAMHGTYEVGEETITFIPYDKKNPVVVDYKLIFGDDVPYIYMSLDGESRLFSEPLI